MMDILKMELIKLNNEIDMIETVLEVHEDRELVERLEQLSIERDEIIKQLRILN